MSDITNKPLCLSNEGTSFSSERKPSTIPIARRTLLDLFVRPAHFFSSPHALAKSYLVVLVSLCLGIASVVDRVEQHVLRAEMGRAPSGWESVGPWLFYSWSNLWVCLIGFGAVMGPLLWYGGGWWYRLRLKWSGARTPDKLNPRLLYAYSSLVYALPVVTLVIGETLLFPSYLVARDSEGHWTLIFVVLSFWSVLVSYRGATATFQLARNRALLWFLFLPWATYTTELGLWAWLYVTMSDRLAGSI